ncbi:hypothetical protein [Spirosoma agri]|uniref:Uncharacterized protein n=1 Tax=Spirosoma agri TaxID=1987381 RepID=A0A6M0IC93_9BACT|nr:hypothetical protein [Spirosoma agri]NEU65860.1 hypothetical protein [Spirosoma agri]
MKNFIYASLVTASLMSCSTDGSISSSVIVPGASGSTSVAPNENVSALFQQFHGKYKVISSTSNQPVDVNQDGDSSSDLLTEIPELRLQAGTQYHIDIRIYGPSATSSKPHFSFTQWWPEQYIRTGVGRVWDGGELISYNPDYLVKYDFQGAGRSFSFSTDLKQLTINANENENPFRWVRPESVTIDATGRISVVNKRRLYTRAGVQEVLITTVYERFTMTT